jgi:hypothetical protein
MARRHDGVAVHEVSGPSQACQRGDRQALEERNRDIYSQPTLKVRDSWLEKRVIAMTQIQDGAAKRTRTSTPVKELAPQASASTSSAMAANG